VLGGINWDKVASELTDEICITIDLDVFDPSIMPATGTPEPGGLGWYDVLGVLRKVIAKKKVVGFDVVELCPLPGNIAPDFLSAKLLYKIMGYMNEGRGKKRR
jgi:agmatinase